MAESPKRAILPRHSVPAESAFHEMLEQEKLAALAEFAAGAGHEINNPLAVICGRAELLLRHEKDPERRRDLATIHRQAMRVHDLIADLMLFARPPEPRFESLDVMHVLDVLGDELAVKFQEKRAQLKREGNQRPLLASADRVQLLVVLHELCDNALREIPAGGCVLISAGLVGAGSGFRVQGSEFEDLGQTADSGMLNPEPCLLNPAVQITVQDDGPGITDEVRRHLFDPFYSGHAAGRGLGMGLAKCWRIITAHGGRIDVVSELGQGTTFTIMLPPLQRTEKSSNLAEGDVI